MKRYKILIAFFLTTAAFVYLFYPKVNTTDVSEIHNRVQYDRTVASAVTTPEIQQMTEQEISRDTSTERTPTILTSEIKVLHQNYPDKEKVNEDVRLNPHTPSKTLMSFARKMAPLMEKAFRNESDATLMMKELSNCAYDESVANAARAMCVKNTERLSETFPKLEKSAHDLRAGVSPEIQKILDTNDAAIRK